jgi:hypothetical protein
MAVIAGEKVMLQLETATPGTYADVVQVKGTGFPNPTVGEVKKTNLASTVQEWRPGKIPDNGTIKFTVQYDPNDTTHQALYTVLYAGTTKNWKLIYADGLTTPAFETFAGFLTAFEKGDQDAETEANVQADITLRITGAVTRTAGTP